MEKILEQMVTNCQDRLKELNDYLEVSYNTEIYSEDEDYQWVKGYRYATHREIDFLTNLLENLPRK